MERYIGSRQEAPGVGVAGGENLPNFVFIMTDQQRADSLGCYGNPRVRTPHLDALGASGVRADRCYVASPVCMPNRASIMTGRMPSVHRVRMNGIPLSLHENTFVELLRLRGYATALIGKSHLQNMMDVAPYVQATRSGDRWSPPGMANEAVRSGQGEDYGQELPTRWQSGMRPDCATPFYGFEKVRLCTGHGDMVGGHYAHWLRERGIDPVKVCGPQNGLPHDFVCPQAWRTRLPEELYPTRYIEDQTVAYLREHARSGGARPFFLAMSFPDPHHPFTPPGKYWSMYDPEDQELPASFDCRDDVLPQVRWAREQRRRAPISPHTYSGFAVTGREAKEAIALTYGMITMIDDAVGRVVSTLRDLGLGDNTVIVFTSDHGDYLGDHGLLLKGPLHLHSLLRVPLIWFDPRASAGARVLPDPCSSIDISATILDRAGIEPYNGIQGRTLLSACAGEPQQRRPILIEEDAQQAHFGFDRAPRIRTLITKRYRLTLYGRTGHGELFDLRDDPDELMNRWLCDDFRNVRDRLLEELALTEMEAGDTSPWPVYLA